MRGKKRRLAVVALGGHAILPKDAQPTVAAQFRATRSAMAHVAGLVQDGWRVVLTHGNGPQVGHILIRTEAAAGKAYPIPLSVAVAESEGEIGYVVQQSLQNALAARGLSRPIVTVLTQVLVDPADPAFRHPTKPIGPVLDATRARALRRNGVPLARFVGQGWRRVVASPEPLRIVEADVVRRLAGLDVVTIAAGGGGIPVAGARGRMRGVDAVIDKDLASAVLADDIGAILLLVLTDVRKVALRFGQADQEDIARMTVAQARRYQAQGHFPPGTMGPKVEAAVRFVQGAPGRRAIITTPGALAAALRGTDGTHVVRSAARARTTEGSP